MATYEEIYGKRVKDFDSDPTLDSSYEGQVWYNSATGTLKSVVSFAAWSSTSNAINISYNTTGFGAQTASVFVGGSRPSYNDNTQEYNGSGFSVGGTYPESRGSIGTAGVLTAGLAWGGNSSPEFESQLTNEYNGTAWTNVNNYPITVAAPAGAGTQTAGLGAGGWDYSGPFSAKNTTNEYDGTNWTGGGNLNTARSSFWGGGTQTAAIMAGGDKFTPGTASDYGAETEEYNGTAWTSVNSLPGTTNGQGGRTTNGVQTDFRVFSGSQGTAFTSPHVNQYEYDGTNWAAGPNYTTARYGAAGSGTGPAAIMTGGRTPSDVLTTEEFNKSINTITAAAWASGGALSGIARNYNVGCGINTAGLSVGGYNPSTGTLSLTEEYDGSVWANGGTLGTASYDSGVSGTQTAALKAGNMPGYPTATEEYDGSSWTAGGTLSTGRGENAAAGIQTASLAISGGTPDPGSITTVEAYNGTSWTSSPSVNVGRRGKPGGSGTSTAALFFGGYTSPPSPSNMVASTESYDGSSWSEVNNLIEARFSGGPAQNGTQTSSLFAAGYTPASNASATANGWDGTSWSTRPSMAQGVRHLAGAGSGNSSAMIFGGYNGSTRVQSTEEFTGETETVTAATLTTS